MTLAPELRPIDFAAALGVKPQQVNYLLDHGLPTDINVSGIRMIPTMDAVQWVASRDRRSKSKTGAEKLLSEGLQIGETEEPVDDESFHDARARKERASASLEELKFDERRGELCNRADSQKEFDTVAAGFVKGILRRAPSRIAPYLVGKDVRQITSILKEELRKELEQ